MSDFVGDDRPTRSIAALIQSSLDELDAGITIFDANLKLVLANRRFLELREIPIHLGEIGTSFEDQVRFRAERGDYGPGAAEDLVREHVELAKKFEVHRIERTRRDGTVLEIRGDPLPGGGFVATYTDITDRKRAEEALQSHNVDLELAKSAYERQGETVAALAEELDAAQWELQAMSHAKSEFLANMSHELRTPLNAIIGFSELIKGQAFGPIGTPKYLEYAEGINESGIHLLELINDILDLSKIEAGQLELHDEDIDAASVIQSCLRLVSEHAAACNVALEAQIPEDLPKIHADARKFRQILLNLLSNAIKFTPAGGTVKLEAAAGRRRGFVVKVIDTGIGIAEADIAAALSPFGQIDSDVSRECNGTGLGLPLTKALAELHDGSLDLHSTVGIGTTAILRLPASRIAAEDRDRLTRAS